MSDWINVKDRLPNDKLDKFYGGAEGSWGVGVILWFHEYRIESAYFDSIDKKFHAFGMTENAIDSATHWMIPEPPKEEE